MTSLFDNIMKKTDFYCIVPDDKKIATMMNVQNLRVAILVYLFYEDQVEFYCGYLKEVPNFVDIYIISSKDTILNQFVSERYITIKKENRGRDISALLVSAKNIVFQYEYICFIHDKKEKSLDTKSFVDLWRKNLWDNMLQSEIYINNVLELFESEEKLGMLVPLPPHEGDRGVWLKGSWGNNFENTKRLADNLNIRVSISKENPPIAYSTVFWAKSQVMKKIFLKDWDNADFPNEPIKDDGELNHAIERILQYIVEDAGYETKILLSSSFAIGFINQLRNEEIDFWNRMDNSFSICNYADFDNYNRRIKSIVHFYKNNSQIFLYGAGQICKECLKICKILDIFPKGILVTSINDNPVNIGGIPVISVADFNFKDNIGIIIAVSKSNQSEIIENLNRNNFYNYITFY